ncbi:MAG: tol-pal system protein YbgF [Betaproteobacteria bacterium]|nr:tol-pal system protein YbgF [Betaproteobacteria bacterium]
MRFHFRPHPFLLAFFLWQASGAACAGMFDDDEARRQISELKTQTNESLDAAARARLDLANQIAALKDEIARLRGQVETLNYELEMAKKRQQDFYVDLDGRLRKIETPSSAAADGSARKGASETDPAAESRAYETALDQFKNGKYKEAETAFSEFIRTHPESELAPSAQYWLGNTYYALRDFKRAIEEERQVLAKWPNHARVPDALFTLGAAQQDSGDAKAGRQTLESLVSKYPGTQAADNAARRLKKK